MLGSTGCSMDVWSTRHLLGVLRVLGVQWMCGAPDICLGNCEYWVFNGCIEHQTFAWGTASTGCSMDVWSTRHLFGVLGVLAVQLMCGAPDICLGACEYWVFNGCVEHQTFAWGTASTGCSMDVWSARHLLGVLGVLAVQWMCGAPDICLGYCEDWVFNGCLEHQTFAWGTASTGCSMDFWSTRHLLGVLGALGFQWMYGAPVMCLGY